jgi:diguanylate cyclase (GGDEF)-like protein
MAAAADISNKDPAAAPGFTVAMRKKAQTHRQHDPALQLKLALIERAYLAVVAAIALCAIAVRQMPQLAHTLPGDWTPVTPLIALALLLSAAGLELSRPRHATAIKAVGAVLVGILAALSGVVLVAGLLHIPLDRFASGGLNQPEPMPLLSAAAFAALATALLLSPARKGLASHAADFFVSLFCFLALAMVRSYLFEGLSNASSTNRTSLLTLLAFALLAFVAFMRRAETGIFSTLLGAGSGSRIARIAAPIVLLVPFLPQTGLANAVRSGWLNAAYVSQIVSFLAACVVLILLLSMALKINRLEAKILDLALRDEVTGLHNRRGFQMVAWQILRQARRDGLAFSIMFIELENAAEIQSGFGPEVGEEALVEMAEVLVAAFRATDVVGRVDPAQFALAGHFDQKSSNIMRLRLQEAVNYRNANPGRTYTLAVAIQCVHAKDPRVESLEELMGEAESPRDLELPASEPVVRDRRQDTPQ